MAPVEVMGRPRRGESERVSTIGAHRTIPVINPMHYEGARATFRSRLFRRRPTPPVAHIMRELLTTGYVWANKASGLSRTTC